MEYDLHKPNGKRVVRALARCGECRVPIYEPIDPNKSYYVITTAFLAKGGDDFKLLKQNYRSQHEMGMFTKFYLLNLAGLGSRTVSQSAVQALGNNSNKSKIIFIIE